MPLTKSIKITQTIPSPGTEACGLAWDGRAFWYYDLADNTLFYVGVNGKVIKKFNIPNGCCDTEYDGQHVWQAAPEILKIFKINPANGKIIAEITTSDKISGLCYDGKNWYRGSWIRKEVIRFDPVTGKDIEAIKTNATTSGIAYDGKYLWHGGEIDKHNYLYKVDHKKG
ncbi:MAG: YncE family protein, partial [Candidatus Zixiibacteriota bacterium]